MHPLVHRHLDRRRGAHRDPPAGGGPLTTAIATARARTFHVWTIGCQMNLADSESLARRLLAAGYVEAPDLEAADIAVLNTCVVRQGSEDKVYSKLHELRRWKTPGRTIALTGCLVAKEGDGLRDRFAHLDAVVPIGDYGPFVEQLDARYDWSLGEPLPVAGRAGVSRYVSVIRGCDHSCTFCIVPRVRGRERHRPLPGVMAECEAAVREGAREVVLLGQNVDDYHDPDGAGGLTALVGAVASIGGLRRVRFMTSHPQDLEPELLDLMASEPKVAHELQLPVQSGDDGILKRMARGYQVRHYRDIVDRARSLIPDLGLYTDVIVGFPGETEQAFLNTVGLLEEVQFDVVHAAIYSPRPGTVAAERWPDDVPAEEKRRRINEVLRIQREIAGSRARRWIGRAVEVLVEGADGLGRPVGRNRQGKRVMIKRSRAAPGEMVEVRVDESSPGQLAGIPAN